MSIRIVKLIPHPSGYLGVFAEIAARGADKYSRPLPFFVDTASDQTLIVKHWLAHCEKEGIEFEKKSHRVQTLVGEAEVRYAREMDLVFDGLPPSAARVPVPKVSLVVKGLQGLRAPDHEGDGALVPYNILGLDVLRDFLLIAQPGSAGGGYLVQGVEDPAAIVLDGRSIGEWCGPEETVEVLDEQWLG